jgi:hypothetical protein
MRTRSWLRTAVLAAAFALGAAAANAAVVGAPASPVLPVENAEARAQLHDTIFGPVRDVSRSRGRVLAQRTGAPRVSFQVEVQSGAVFMIFANARGSAFPLAAAGTYIIKRSMADGSFLQAKVFLQDDEETYVRLTPDGDRTMMDVVLFHLPFQSHVTLPVPFDSLVTSPFSRVMDLSRASVDWGLVLAPAQDEADQRLQEIATALRARLPGLRDMDDGAMDAAGRMVYIATGVAAGKGGFNCSGFAKWVADGFFSPLAGHPMDIAPLKARDAGIAKTWSSRYEELYDPYFGLDWSRGLARSIGQARTGVTPSDEEVDVRDDSRVPYIRDVGYPMASLKAELYFLARREPGVMYIGSVNAPSALAVAAGMPTLRQHHHVVVLLPYFDDRGVFHVVVMERNLETGIPSLQRRFGTEYVNLVRITTDGGFQLPALP